ncbi:DUF4129 domain-containing protein [Paenibacillus sp. NPDC056579]|uniref:DUF4129 domain-containing protein n=1 Tax=Paenibacillus sp. NPDC056579 TaxID=3345871 RepID=UPI00367969EE
MSFLSRMGAAVLKGCAELLLFLPLLLVLSVYVLPENVRWIWLATLPVCYAAGFAAATWIRITRLFQLLFLIACLGGGYTYLLFGTDLIALVSIPIACIAVYRGIKLTEVPWYMLFPASFFLLGMILYFFASVILHFMPEFEPFMPLLTGGGLVSLAVTLFVTNESNMKQESLPGDKEPVIASEMKWKNRLLIGLVLLLIALIVAFRMLQQAMGWLKEQLAALLRALFASSDKPPAMVPEQKPQPTPPNLGVSEAPPVWLEVLEKIFYYITAAVIIAAVLYLLYRIAIKIPGWARLFFTWLAGKLRSNDMRASRTGYEDDVESLMDWDQLGSQLFSRWRRWFGGSRPEKWEDMATNRDRIRFLYRSWLRQSIHQGYRIKRYLTPRETGREIEAWHKLPPDETDKLVAMYDSVRYGDKDAVSDQEVLALKRAMEKKQ